MPDGTDFLRGADRRITPARSDLAALSLKGMVDSENFAEPSLNQIKTAIVPMRADPAADGKIDTVLLYGESFDVYDTADGWAWGQATRDGYVGYIPHATLSDAVITPTHTVSVPMTHLYPVASMKSEPVAALWMSSLATPSAFNEPNDEGVAFAELDGFFVPEKHLTPVDKPAQDYVGVAESLLHAPYIWGGKTAAGIDCSGLVQVAFARTGADVARDSDMQAATLGTEIVPGTPLQRGDLLFWPGHVGIMINTTTLLHATAFAMQVITEPVKTARKRIEDTLDLPLQCVRRP